MYVLFLLCALAGILVLPVMLGARFVGAERTGFGPALVAVVLQSCLVFAVGYFAPNVLGVLVGFVLGAVLYAYTLGTTVPRGAGISVVSGGISMVISFLFASSFAIMASAP
ncbi:hypothetical protein [Cognatilysobacter lacus]|uniref:Uncharacterized protein n=1 Tax=Cognatilysobacter lacus TaxID=1643323 RepID=A0A5D8YF72_9GAMM|nr:hypothetical protein [Lysobacter lacus]TZF81395.1 hypothetical protein FW784_13645 [Lysobacter lacus]